MIAKNMYVASRSGWVSDRSICYLASGRPVVAQDTGFSELYPVGEGLLAFDDLDGAVGGAGAKCPATTPATPRDARALAEEHFDSERGARGGCSAELGIP